MNEVRIPNISPVERRKRLMGGLIMLVLGGIVLAAFIAFGLNPWWRLALFPLFAGGMSGFFQWRDKTWTGLAARGSRQLDANVEKIEDQEELAQVQRQARRVHVKATAVGLLMTLLTFLIPS
jgi:hypothetical protein